MNGNLSLFYVQLLQYSARRNDLALCRIDFVLLRVQLRSHSGRDKGSTHIMKLGRTSALLRVALLEIARNRHGST